MQLKDTELASHCKKNGLLPIYWIAGDDALQRREACDALREQAKRSGFQREIITVTPQFSWDSLIQKIDHYDMFSQRQYWEIHHPSGKFDSKAQAALQHFFDCAPDDKRIAIVSHKLSTSQKKSKLAQSINQHGAVIWLWPPNRLALPKWIETRLKLKNLSADKHAIALLAQYSEGDLSTAQQTIDKLLLLKPSLPITAQVVQNLISDHANFSVFDCVDAALMGQPKRCLRLLTGLKSTNQEATFVLWALTQQIKLLYGMRHQLDNGQRMTAVLKGQWEKRQPMLQTALKRLTLDHLRQYLVDAFQVDLSIKGVRSTDPWQLLETLYLNMATAHALVGA